MTRLIDADKLIRCLRNDPLFKFVEQFGITGVIDAQPTVDAVPVKHARLANAHPYGECSYCGELIDVRSGFNYCPNCGARMDEE